MNWRDTDPVEVIALAFILIVAAIGVAVVGFIIWGPDRESSEDRALRKAKEWSGTPACIAFHPKHETLSFCVAGRALIICGNDDECLTVQLDPVAEKPCVRDLAHDVPCDNVTSDDGGGP